MTFAARETSRTLGAPVALFLFRYGTRGGDVYGYTSSEDAITTGGVTYLPVPIHNGSFAASGALDKSALELRLDKTLPIAILFSTYPPSSVVTLKIYEGHVGETEFKAIWTGRLLGHKIEGDEIVFTCEPISTALRRSGLRRNYQFGCPHVLYGAQCGADKPAATINVFVSDVQNPYVELPANWAPALDQVYYLNGMAQWTTATGLVEVRSIIRMTSLTEIQLGGDISTLLLGMTISLSKGCDHQQTGCRLHNNINNYGGCPWIPLKNPIGVQNNFS